MSDLLNQQCAVEPKSEVERLREELADWRRWGIIEIMVRNPSVDSFVNEKEAELARAYRLLGQLMKAGRTLGWHADYGDETRLGALLKEIDQLLEYVNPMTRSNREDGR